MFRQLYHKTNHGTILIISLLLITGSIISGIYRTGEFPTLNLVFFIVGPAAFFWPGIVLDEGEAGRLRRKLIWVLFGAAVIISILEAARRIAE